MTGHIFLHERATYWSQTVLFKLSILVAGGKLNAFSRFTRFFQITKIFEVLFESITDSLPEARFVAKVNFLYL